MIVDENTYLPKRFTIQWHITDRCNNRCKHCYQESYMKNDLDLETLTKILHEQYIPFFVKIKNNSPLKAPGRLNVTGGEPFIRNDFMDLLEIISRYKDLFSIGIMTNGSFINESVVEDLKEFGVSNVQISIDGKKETHDSIRGAGDFEKCVLALKYLIAWEIKTSISFTANSHNYKEFTDVAKLGMHIGTNMVWSDRMIPCGAGSGIKDMTIDQTKEFFELMMKAKIKAAAHKMEIPCHRALQFLVSGGYPYKCGAGDRLITVLPDGGVLPCRRMPIPVGNLLEDNLEDIYYGSEVLEKLRYHNNQIVNKGCEDCRYRRACRGGLKCLSYAVTGSPFKADPGCWLANNEEVK